VKITRVRGAAASRLIIGRVLDTPLSRYRVDLYRLVEGAWTLTRSVNPGRGGVWKAGKVGGGSLRALLVSRDHVAPEVLQDPVLFDGIMVVAETIRE